MLQAIIVDKFAYLHRYPGSQPITPITSAKSFHDKSILSSVRYIFQFSYDLGFSRCITHSRSLCLRQLPRFQSGTGFAFGDSHQRFSSNTSISSGIGQAAATSELKPPRYVPLSCLSSPPKQTPIPIPNEVKPHNDDLRNAGCNPLSQIYRKSRLNPLVTLSLFTVGNRSQPRLRQGRAASSYAVRSSRRWRGRRGGGGGAYNLGF
jgi:hypothetical protein